MENVIIQTCKNIKVKLGRVTQQYLHLRKLSQESCYELQSGLGYSVRTYLKYQPTKTPRS